MRCDGCGHEAVAMKTVVCRNNVDRRGVLCDPCYEPVADRLWIVPGPVACFGRCHSCSEWFSVRELTDLKPGGGHGAWIGTCRICVEAN